MVAGGTLIKLASAIHKVAKYYYHGPKRSSNKIQILKTKFKFEKNEFNIPMPDYYINWIHLESIHVYLPESRISYCPDTRVCIRKSISGWVLVISEVPQGSVIGPLLFILYVDDLPDPIKNGIHMFADDTKIWKVINSDHKVTSLQYHLDELAKWSDKCLLRFNTDKCKVMHLGHRTPASYYLQEGPVRKLLQTVNEERDLGVYVTADLKLSFHCGEAAAKASSVLGLIQRHFKYIDKESFLILYKAYIRHHIYTVSGKKVTP